MIRATLPGVVALLVALVLPASAPAREPEPLQRRDARLLEAAIETMPVQRPGVIDLYALGFAGDGTEKVFRNEVEYFETLMRQRFHARGVMGLVNHIDSIQGTPRPLATYENLRDALAGMATRMDVDEDILLLYVTMHGTPEHELAVYFPPFVEDALIPEDLRVVLDDAGIRNRVLVLSACYSGGFLRELRNPDTLVITAARADRPSFGCGAESTVTWFGRAWMLEGLNQSSSFEGAYALATGRIKQWEAAEKIEASFPQLQQGARIRQRLRDWQAALEPGAPIAYPYPLDALPAPR